MDASGPLQARILVLAIADDPASQHIALMNTFFAAQKEVSLVVCTT